MDEVSWADAESWERAKTRVMEEGKRPTVGPICRDCLRLIPREYEERWDIRDSMCKCGNTTTKRADAKAHGIMLTPLVSGSLDLYE